MQQLYTSFNNALYSGIAKKSLLFFLSFFLVTVLFAQPTISSFTPSSGAAGTLVTITGTNLTSPTGFTIGGVSAIAVSNDGSTLVGMVMPGASTGTVVVTTGSGTATSASNFSVSATNYPSAQQGSKLVGNDAISGFVYQGYSVAVSADGNTALVGGYRDNNLEGAAWVYTRSGSTWTQQGTKLLANDNTGAAQQGTSVALSADGNTAIVGGNNDNNGIGAAWVYTRSGSTWTQQGSKLIANDYSGIWTPYLGQSVSLSADGNTAIVSGYQDAFRIGAVWVFIRSGGTWTQQGSKLIGTGATGNAIQGNSVALSADGNTVLFGGINDNSHVGAAWVYTRSGGTWTQQGTKLLANDNTGAAQQGISVALSADGNTAIVGGDQDNSNIGAAWVYTRSAGVWTQQGSKLVGTGAVGTAYQGVSVALSADGNIAMVGGTRDNSGAGAIWVYVRSGSTWTQQGNKLVGTGGTANSQLGASISLRADGNTAIVGGYGDNSNIGAAWVYTYTAPPTISSFSPSTGAVGTLVTITGTNLSSPTTLTIGGVSAIAISNTGTSLVAMVMPGSATGTVVVTTAGGTATSASNFTVTATNYPSVQQGSKLVGTGNTGAALQGQSVSVSADGNTAIVGGNGDNTNQGAVWVYTRSGSTWTQQGSKLVGTGGSSDAGQGVSVSISADGNTALFGGPNDNSGNGAAWVFTRSGSTWTQQGSKLVGTGNSGAAAQGQSVSLSADGNTAILGGYADNSNQGATWVFTRSGSTWTQQGSKLTGTGNSGAARQGISVSISGDGNTAISGGWDDNGGVGAAWIFTRSGNTWTQQGSKLVGTGSSGTPVQGNSVCINADGNTAMISGYGDNSLQGAAWIFTRSAGTWTQQGSKLVGTGNSGAAFQAFSLALSADGNTAMEGGIADNTNQGAVWVFTRSGSTWTQQGTKLVGTGNSGAAQQGISLAMSADGNTAIFGGNPDNSNQGAAWVYTYVPPPTISSFTASSGAIGTLVTITGTNLSNPTALTIGGVSAIAISNTGTSLVAMVMPGATTGTVVVNTGSGTATSASNFTVTATNYPSAQQGSKLVGTSASDPASQGLSVAVSSDGNTAIVGGYNDNSGVGAAWVYTRSGNTWTQQGSKLVGTGTTGNAQQGQKVSLSADGNTAIVGGYHDNSNTGAVWIYTRTAGVWAQQGSKLTANDNIGAAQQGRSVSLSADGNTAIVGGYADNSNAGAVWIYTRTAGVWTQQGSKLVGTGATGAAQQGQSACLSSDGNTAVVGGIYDNTNIGAFWVYTRSGGVWTQQGSKLIGTGGSSAAYQGASACLSADGNTVIEGGFGDNSNAGAVWVFTRSGSTWTQQGTKLVGTGGSADARQGTSVSLSADGNTAIISGYTDNSNTGAAWVYTRSGSTWTQQGNKLIGTNAVGAAQQGATVSLSADGSTAIEGGFVDNSNAGAAWVFIPSNIWTGATNTDWATATNWSYGTVPVSTDAVIIPSVSNQPIISTTQTVNNITIISSASLTINSPGILTANGTVTNNGTLTVAAGGSLKNSSAIGNVTLQQSVIGQRGFRLFANPFSTAQTIASVASNNGITIGTSVPTSGLTDSRIFSSNAWANVTGTTWAANTPYALFIRGLTTEVTGLTYTGGPSAFTYSVSGTLNGNSTSITPANTSDFILVGNPYAAPVNTQALTGQNPAPYYTYQIAVSGTPQVDAGGWVASGGNSNISTTIPVLGVVAYKPASTSTFNITTSDINTGGTLQTGLFGVEPSTTQLELLVEQSGYFKDKMFVRLDATATTNGTDYYELKKLYNTNVNVYSITPDDSRMAIDARNVLSTIPLGISALPGNYNFKLSNNNLPVGTTVYLNDKLLNTQAELKAGDVYNFSITSDAATHGEQRFSLSFSSKTTLIATDPTDGLTANVLGNITNSNLIAVQIAGATAPVTIAIKDMSGKAISNVNAVNGIQYVNVGNAASGMLILQISDGKNSVTKKVIKL